MIAILDSLLDLLFPRRSLTGEYGSFVTEEEGRQLQSFPLRFDRPVLRARGVTFLDRLVAASSYASSPLLRKAVHTCKYGKIPAMGEELGRLLERAIPLLGFEKATKETPALELSSVRGAAKATKESNDSRRSDAIVSPFVLRQAQDDIAQGDTMPVLCPVPLHWTRMFSRGFNQAEILATIVSPITGWPVRPLLRRWFPTGFQARRTRSERRNALKGVFHCTVGCVPPFVVLIDDIATSGATLDECARVLKEHGARRVEGLVVAQG